MSKFLDQITPLLVVQLILILLVVGAWVYLMLAGTPVPPALDAGVGLVIGFFFGGKVEQSRAAALRG